MIVIIKAIEAVQDEILMYRVDKAIGRELGRGPITPLRLARGWLSLQARRAKWWVQLKWKGL